jgi:hypothetical protein
LRGTCHAQAFGGRLTTSPFGPGVIRAQLEPAALAVDGTTVQGFGCEAASERRHPPLALPADPMAA